MPLKLWAGVKVSSSNHIDVFDFIHDFHNLGKAFNISDEQRQKVVDIINGEREPKEHTKNDVTYRIEKGIIYATYDGVEYSFILIRGWGQLTGQGGLKLSAEEAIKIQNESAEYIVKQLTR